MDALDKLIDQSGFAGLIWQNLVMFGIGGLLIYLAVVKKYEPLLLIPIGFGAILANLPLAKMGAGAEGGVLWFVYRLGIETKFLPPVIFLGIGAFTDFRPLLSRPITFLLGAAAQFGIFVAAMGAYAIFSIMQKGATDLELMRQAASVGIIGGADGPTTIFVASQLAPDLLGAVAVAAYSYMALVPVIQPPIMKALTSDAERAIDMPMAKPVSRTAVVLFPITVAVLASLFIPACAPLLGMLMFGNLLRESGVTDRLGKTAGGPLINIVTIFLGLVVGATMAGATFLRAETIFILILGAIAFSCSTFGGVIFAKLLNVFLPEGKKINPCIGAAGVSAVPMAARVVQDFVAKETDGKVNPLMVAMGPNVAGVIGSAVAAGVFLALFG